MAVLEDFKLDNLPDTCCYIPNFITESEEKLLIHEIYKTPITRWTQLSHRRLINIGGVPTAKGMIAEEIPQYLQKYVDKINSFNVFPKNSLANHILLNEYKAGEGIMSHFDGPMFFPTISTLSIGSHCVLEFSRPPKADDDKFQSTPELKLLVEPRSLLVLKDTLYTDYMHGISEIQEDDLTDPLIRNLEKCSYLETTKISRSTRISLTIRHVPKTSKLKLKFFK